VARIAGLDRLALARPETRIPRLAELDEEEVNDLVTEASLTRAKRRLAKAWLAEHTADAD